jgi:hypothetical protein
MPRQKNMPQHNGAGASTFHVTGLVLSVYAYDTYVGNDWTTSLLQVELALSIFPGACGLGAGN